MVAADRKSFFASITSLAMRPIVGDSNMRPGVKNP